MSKPEMLERVEALLREVVAWRVQIWERAWAGGRHPESPPKPSLKPKPAS